MTSTSLDVARLDSTAQHSAPLRATPRRDSARRAARPAQQQHEETNPEFKKLMGDRDYKAYVEAERCRGLAEDAEDYSSIYFSQPYTLPHNSISHIGEKPTEFPAGLVPYVSARTELMAKAYQGEPSRAQTAADVVTVLHGPVECLVLQVLRLVATLVNDVAHQRAQLALIVRDDVGFKK